VSEEWKTKFRSRKWALTCGIFAVSSVGLAAGKLSGAEFSGVMSVLSVAYNWANVKDASS